MDGQLLPVKVKGSNISPPLRSGAFTPPASMGWQQSEIVTELFRPLLGRNNGFQLIKSVNKLYGLSIMKMGRDTR